MKQPIINFNFTRSVNVASALVFAFGVAMAALLPILLSGQVNAATLTSRNLTMSTSRASATGVNYQFNFTLPSGTAVQSMIFEFCTTPLGACTHPTGQDNNYTLAATSATQTFSEATLFTEYAGADLGACDDHNNGTPANSTEYCVSRTDTDAETAAAKQLTITTVTNPSTEASFYPRIHIYSDASFGTEVHSGVVAGAVVNQLTVTGRVQERLQFCVAAIGDGGGTDTTLPADVATCIALSETTVDIGVIDNVSAISMAPVDNTTSLLGDDEYGIAMVNTNASSGVGITFFAEDASAVLSSDTDQLKSFRVIPTDCAAAATDLTDQCFRSAAGDTTGGTSLTIGAERFGVYVPCVDTTQGVTATPMTVDTDFDGFDATTASVVDCENADKSDNGSLPTVAWNDTATASTIATSAGVLDDPIVKLSFAATASATTPTGTYTVVTTYIATGTF
jgi:hypothetical protein